MDFQALVIYRSVAKSGSFSAAAHELNYAQSNISTKIQHLESELQTTLFYRHNRGIMLTQKGESFLKYTEEIIDMINKTETAMKDDGIAKGSLSIGSLETIASIYLPTMLATYHHNNPDVTLSIKTGSTAEHIDSVLNRTLDGAFISGNISNEDLVCVKFKSENLLLATASIHENISSWHNLQNKTLLVFPNGCYYRHLLESLLKDEGIIPNQIIEFNSLNAMISSLCAGLGISLLPESMISNYRNSDIISTFKIPEKYSSVPTVFIYRKDYYLNTAFIELLNILQK
ncbi:MAG: gltR 1 [Eubacterium sp.]|jgi:DNA-binding transcriptional LysR family regulator|nr:gltR 1 [Eubacterium sp.]